MQYETIRIDHAAAMDAPADRYFDRDGVTAYSSLIPQTYTEATRVHFVSGAEGEEYGQFAAREQAEALAAFLVTLPAEQRKDFER